MKTSNGLYVKMFIGAGVIVLVLAFILAYKDGGFRTYHFALFMISSALTMMGGVLAVKANQTKN